MAASLRCLGTDSYVLRFADLTVLLDCPLDLRALAAFVPQFFTHSFGGERVHVVVDGAETALRAGVTVLNAHSFLTGPFRVRCPRLDMIDAAAIDLVLVSSHVGMLGLPMLTRNPAFRGRIFATEPVVEIGRQLMMELVHFLSETVTAPRPEAGTSTASPAQLSSASLLAAVEQGVLPPFACSIADADSWTELYSADDVDQCVRRIHSCSYLQNVSTYCDVVVKPTSSGFALGACNWILQDGNFRAAYLAASSSATGRHPAPFDFASLANCNLILVTQLSREPTYNPEQMANEFCTQVLSTIKRRGNVLVPCLPTGVLYDLIEMLATYLASMNVTQTPMYVVSSVADQSIEYANILGEWMCGPRQDQTFLPEPPFTHAELLRSGRLQRFPNLHSGFGNALRSPAIVFAGHPSLRCGEIVHLIRMWGTSPKNAIIFTDADYPPDSLTPFQPLAMRVHYTPIDPRLNFADVNGLLEKSKPRQLCLHRSLLPPPNSAGDRSAHVLPLQDRSPDATASFVAAGDNVVLATPDSSVQMDRALLSERLAREVQPVVIGTKRVQRLAAVLATNDHHFVLSPPSKKQAKTMMAKRRRLLFGSVGLDSLLEHLLDSDVGSVEVHTQPDHSSVTIDLPTLHARIRLEGGRTSVEVADRETRTLLRRILLEQLLPL